jgi:hypothetical protein
MRGLFCAQDVGTVKVSAAIATTMLVSVFFKWRSSLPGV